MSTDIRISFELCSSLGLYILRFNAGRGLVSFDIDKCAEKSMLLVKQVKQEVIILSWETHVVGRKTLEPLVSNTAVAGALFCVL